MAPTGLTNGSERPRVLTCTTRVRRHTNVFAFHSAMFESHVHRLSAVALFPAKRPRKMDQRRIDLAGDSAGVQRE